MSDDARANANAKVKRALWAAGAIVALALAFWLGGVVLGGGDGSPAPDEEAATDDGAEVWTCSMHPQVRASEPGQCPICGMDLIPVDAAAPESTPTHVSLSEEARIRARIRTTEVGRAGESGALRRLLGRVDYDETRLRTVTSWISGRIDRLHVRTTGQRVRKGQVIATLYSPEVFNAHQDLLVAVTQKKKLAGATEGAQAGARAAIEAARNRLRLLGIPAQEIADMEQATRPSEEIKVRSPFTGTIIERLATEGSYVQTGAGLYQIADLSRLWVQLDAYESDLPLLELGQTVRLKVDALPAETFEGKVTFVDPVVNPQTRTTRVRIEVQNPDGKLRPNMYAEAIVQGKQAVGTAETAPLMIPETAPLFTGRRSLVYVEVPDMDSPTYEARVVELGPKMGSSYPVLSGLRAGERVVIHGAFTLDADLQIRGGRSMMTLGGDEVAGVEVPEDLRAPLATVIDHYLHVQHALAEDDLGAARSAARALAKATGAVTAASGTSFAEAWAPLGSAIGEEAAALEGAETLEAARESFLRLSNQVIRVLRIFGNPSEKTVRLAFCPMAAGGDGAEWVQEADRVENPYYGESMDTCGEVRESVEQGGHLGGADDSAPAGGAAPGGHSH